MYAAVYHFGPRWPRLVTVALPESKVGEAQERALTQAEPGSDATVVRVRPQPAPSPQQNGPRIEKLERVDVQIQPPPKTLTQQDFENLKQRIMEAEGDRPAAKKARTRSFRAAPPEASGGGGSAERSLGANPTGGAAGVSLSDIRAYKPAD